MLQETETSEPLIDPVVILDELLASDPYVQKAAPAPVEEPRDEFPYRAWDSVQQLATLGERKWSAWTLHALWPEDSADRVSELVTRRIVELHLHSVGEGGAYDVSLTEHGVECVETAITTAQQIHDIMKRRPR